MTEETLFRVDLCSNSYQGYSKANILNSIEPLLSALRSCFVNVLVTIHVHTNSMSRGENDLHSCTKNKYLPRLIVFDTFPNI